MNDRMRAVQLILGKLRARHTDGLKLNQLDVQMIEGLLYEYDVLLVAAGHCRACLRALELLDGHQSLGTYRDGHSFYLANKTLIDGAATHEPTIVAGNDGAGSPGDAGPVGSGKVD